jgi:TatD DNase family protein
MAVMALKTKMLERDPKTALIVELADAHCHLDLIRDSAVISEAIAYGVDTMITNGVDTASNARSVELADGKHIFAALGVDPEHAMAMGEEELNFNIGMIRSNASRIMAIGEVGLDYMKAQSAEERDKQKRVFEGFLELADELHLPVSVHSRNAFDDVIKMVSAHNPERAHIHFFEGNAEQVNEIERLGCMISVPPVESRKRGRAIKKIGLERIMVESDAPIVGATPRDVEKAVRSIALLKGISFERAAEALTSNTKSFFNTRRIGLRC